MPSVPTSGHRGRISDGLTTRAAKYVDTLSSKQNLICAIAPNDIVTSGKYTIQLCGSQAPQVQTALDSLWAALQPAIQDTFLGSSSAAFQAFFKSSRHSRFVRRVLSDIAKGTALRSKASSTPSTPQLACVTGPGLVRFQVKGSFRDVYDDCRKNPLWAAIYYSGLNYVFICPLFFAAGIPARPASRCPTVNPATNQFTGSLNDLVQYRPYVLLHELAHFYVVPPSTENTQFEVYDWNAAFALRAKQAIVNAQSYVLYVASKYRQENFFDPLLFFGSHMNIPYYAKRNLSQVLQQNVQHSQSQRYLIHAVDDWATIHSYPTLDRLVVYGPTAHRVPTVHLYGSMARGSSSNLSPSTLSSYVLARGGTRPGEESTIF